VKVKLLRLGNLGAALKNSQDGLQLGPSEIGFHRFLETLNIVLDKVRKLKNLILAVGDRLQFSTLEASLQGRMDLHFE
jgi:hypothetical protein